MKKKAEQEKVVKQIEDAIEAQDFDAATELLDEHKNFIEWKEYTRLASKCAHAIKDSVKHLMVD